MLDKFKAVQERARRIHKFNSDPNAFDDGFGWADARAQEVEANKRSATPTGTGKEITKLGDRLTVPPAVPAKKSGIAGKLGRLGGVATTGSGRLKR